MLPKASHAPPASWLLWKRKPVGGAISGAGMRLPALDQKTPSSATTRSAFKRKGRTQIEPPPIHSAWEQGGLGSNSPLFFSIYSSTVHYINLSQNLLGLVTIEHLFGTHSLTSPIKDSQMAGAGKKRYHEHWRDHQPEFTILT